MTTVLLLFQGVDYEGVLQKAVQFEEGRDSATVDIMIIDDSLAEGVETFSGKLVVSGPTQNFSTMIMIEILDDERKLNKTEYPSSNLSIFFFLIDQR